MQGWVGGGGGSGNSLKNWSLIAGVGGHEDPLLFLVLLGICYPLSTYEAYKQANTPKWKLS